MPWRIDSPEPETASSEGKDVQGWLWTLVDDESRRSRRIVVEVSGTAMAIDAQFLPLETREARETRGRSEVEKVLEESEPQRRITLGSTGYLTDPPRARFRPDLVLVDSNNEVVAVVEVKNPEILTLPLAAGTRDRIRESYPSVHFILVASQNRGFLFDRSAQQYDPVAEVPLFDVVQRYYRRADPTQRFAANQLELLFAQWLRDLAAGVPTAPEADESLTPSGFLAAVRDTRVVAQQQ